MLTTPQQIFDAMPGAFRPDKAGPVELSLQFDITGSAGGEWAVAIANGECRTWAGSAEDATAAIRASDDDIVAIFTGNLNAVAAYMSGRVQVDGDVTAIMNLLSFFEIPGG